MEITLLAFKQNWFKFEMPALHKIPGHGEGKSRKTLFCHCAADFLVTTLPLCFANGLKRVNIICAGCICLLKKYANVLICFYPVFENYLAVQGLSLGLYMVYKIRNEHQYLQKSRIEPKHDKSSKQSSFTSRVIF